MRSKGAALCLHRGTEALSTFLCAVVMDRLIYEVRQEFLWTAVFTDDVVISCESSEEEKEEVEVCSEEKWSEK